MFVWNLFGLSGCYETPGTYFHLLWEQVFATTPAWLGGGEWSRGCASASSFTVEGEDLLVLEGVDATAPHNSCWTSLWGGEQGLVTAGVGVRVQAPMWSLLTLLRGSSNGGTPPPTPPSVSPPFRGGKAEIQALHLAFVMGVGWCLRPTCGASLSHIIIVWKFAVLLGCLVPDLLLESTGLSFFFHVHWCFWVPTSPAPDPGYKKRKENPGKTSPCPSLAPEVSS